MPKRFRVILNNTIFAIHGPWAIGLQKLHSFVVRVIKLLVQYGEAERGLVLLQEASVKAPHVDTIRYHMAVALDKNGHHEEARKVLARLMKSGESFSDYNEAKALHDSLGYLEK